MDCAVLWILCSSLAVGLAPGRAADETGDDLLKKARTALEKGQMEEALALANKAVAADPENARTYLLRGLVHEAAERHAEAIADFSKTLALDPQAVAAYHHRGTEQFKLGRIAESLADFDKFLEAKPEEKPKHWQRGISCYYAGRFEEGQKQFEGYEQVDRNDVENAVWRYLCMARLAGVDKARAALLKIGNDRRVPMMTVYELFSGRAKPEDVLAAAQAGNPPADELKLRLFFAHLYLGLYYEAAGDKTRALEHLKKAANNYRVKGYMGDVARVHVELRTKEAHRK
jgi:lipoprotein NlpI